MTPKTPDALCESCPLERYPFVPPRSTGHKPRKLVFVGEAPATQEVLAGMPFVGRSGMILQTALNALNIDDAWITNACLCQALEEKQKTPAARCCKQRLLKELSGLMPDCVVLLGNTAMESLLGWNKITKYHGGAYPIPNTSLWAIPTYHPAAVLRNPSLWTDFAGEIEKAKNFVPGVVPAPVQYVVPDGFSWPLREAELSPYAVIDVETTGLDYLRAEILCIVITTAQHTFILPPEILKDPMFGPALQKCKAKWVGHNAKFDAKFVEYLLGVKLHFVFDTMLAHHLLDERKGVHDLKTVARFYLDAPPWEDSLEQHLGKHKDYGDAPKDVLYAYAASDGHYTHQLVDKELELLKPYPKLCKLARETTIPVANALADIELRGAYIDKTELDRVTLQLQKEKAQAEQDLQLALGHPINPRSPVQVSRALFDELHLPQIKGRSTDKTVLAKLSERGNLFVATLLEFRQIDKLLGTYALPIAENLDSNSRLHTTYNVHGTVSGRLSSSTPVNLQNQPARGKRAKLIKNVFTATPGYTLINADLSQVELRLAAVLSGEEFLLNVYRNGLDLHAESARLTFGDGWTQENRAFAKKINFSALYGAGARKIAESAELPGYTVEQAEGFVRRYFSRMPRLVRWMGEVHECLKRDGYVETPQGRRRRYPLLCDENVADAERESVNFLCQSAAAEITLLSLVRLHELLKPLDSFIVLTVHDSIVVEAPIGREVEVAELTKRTMESVGAELYGTEIPFTTNVEQGQRWGELSELDIIEDDNEELQDEDVSG